MKIKNITDTKKFFDLLCHCKGNVELTTPHGDRINLKSTLCQYLAMTDMFQEAKIDEVEIICSEPEDSATLMEYLIRG